MILVPSFLPFAFIIAYLYIRLAPAYILASRDLRRLELTSLSPTFAGFDELLAVRLCFPIHDSLVSHRIRDFRTSGHSRWSLGIKTGFTRRWTNFKVLIMFMLVLLSLLQVPMHLYCSQWLLNVWMRWRYDCRSQCIPILTKM